jgi:hypothetical protein
MPPVFRRIYKSIETVGSTLFQLTSGNQHPLPLPFVRPSSLFGECASASGAADTRGHARTKQVLLAPGQVGCPHP